MTTASRRRTPASSRPPWLRLETHAVIVLFSIVARRCSPFTPSRLPQQLPQRWPYRQPPHQHRHSSPSSTRLSAFAPAWQTSLSTNPVSDEAIREVASSLPVPNSSENERGLAFFFVGQAHADAFERMAKAAHDAAPAGTTTLALLGAGVVGGGEESDDPSSPAVSVLSGVLPSTASADGFLVPSTELDELVARGDDDAIVGRPPSYILFADPWSSIDDVVQGLDKTGAAVVAGGISCPPAERPTVALNGKACGVGSVVGVCLSGTVGLQAIVAQGCRGVGPTMTITGGQGNALTELSSEPALERLRQIAYAASEPDKKLIDAGGMLCGIATPGATNDDFLIRQIIGLIPGQKGGGKGAIIIGTEVKPGDKFRFHVRDSDAAREDLKTMVQRAKTERIFAGPSSAGTPLAAIQVSCVARGRSMFDVPDVDLSGISDLFPPSAGLSAPVAGFFANGEIGPVGVAGAGLGSGNNAKKTYVHGFTAVAAVICDFPPSDAENTSSLEPQDELDAWG